MARAAARAGERIRLRFLPQLRDQSQEWRYVNDELRQGRKLALRAAACRADSGAVAGGTVPSGAVAGGAHPADCCVKCQKTPSCRAWTLAGSQCYLKTCSAFGPLARMPGAVSGVKKS